VDDIEPVERRHTASQADGMGDRLVDRGEFAGEALRHRLAGVERLNSVERGLAVGGDWLGGTDERAVDPLADKDFVSEREPCAALVEAGGEREFEHDGRPVAILGAKQRGVAAGREGGDDGVAVKAVAGLVVISTGPASLGLALALFVLAMLTLGAGNGAVFQLVPQRFRKEIGVMTGLVGCAGGIGGFFLASSLGLAKQWFGTPQVGFLIFAGLAVIALGGVQMVKLRWRTTWGAAIVGVTI